jgi:hypothetical protein
MLILCDQGIQAMFKRQTLFIVGAGASVEFGLPPGKALASLIKNKMDIRFDYGNRPSGTGDHDLFAQLTQRWPSEANQFQQAAWIIRDGIGLAQSIDDFLDLHRTNQFVNLYGKAAIVKAILEAERESTLYFAGRAKDDYFNPQRSENTWLWKLLAMLGRGIPREALGEIFDQVSFIVFNYDRCIEHFFLHALQKLYAVSENQASEVVERLRIFHPNGAVLDVPFGANRAGYADLAAGIKTYTEQIGAQPVIKRLSDEVDKAAAIVFLGFAYHDQNMSLLKPAGPMPTKAIYGTAYGVSDSDVDVTARHILAWYRDPNIRRATKSPVQLNSGLTCAAFFDHYSKTLTAST